MKLLYGMKMDLSERKMQQSVKNYTYTHTHTHTHTRAHKQQV